MHWFLLESEFSQFNNFENITILRFLVQIFRKIFRKKIGKKIAIFLFFFFFFLFSFFFLFFFFFLNLFSEIFVLVSRMVYPHVFLLDLNSLQIWNFSFLTSYFLGNVSSFTSWYNFYRNILRRSTRKCQS